MVSTRTKSYRIFQQHKINQKFNGMSIVVTGGLGFIGSHTVVELQKLGFEVVVIDNLCNSTKDVLTGIEKITGKRPIFENLDLRNKTDVDSFFQKYDNITGVIHFAAFKAVGESVANPLAYYENNLHSLVYVLQHLSEMAVVPAESPYGNTKQIGEEIIRDVCKVYDDLNAIALRYFNPMGAHPSVEIGELPLGVPQNLVPFITQTGVGLRDCLSVFGGDYETADGTCIRDYIHVADLAKAHVIALKRLLNQESNSNFEVFNLNVSLVIN